MKDFYNPLLLLVVVGLLSCRFMDIEGADTWTLWALVLCATGFVVDGALALARALTHRSGVMQVVWSVVFLIVGSCTWVLVSRANDAGAEELAEFRAAYAALQQGGDVNAHNDSGDSVLVLAVECGRENVVRELLQRGDVSAECKLAAAMRAVECNRELELRLLLENGVPVNAAIHGSTLLCAAAAEGQPRVLALLLEQGALPDMVDAAGTPPLVHAVLSGNTAVVKTLLAAGANPAACDAAGRSAASYSRSEKMDKALNGE